MSVIRYLLSQQVDHNLHQLSFQPLLLQHRLLIHQRTAQMGFTNLHQIVLVHHL